MSHLGFELLARLQRKKGWDLIMARNSLFQREVVGSFANELRGCGGKEPILFAYSYAALELLKFAKARGWRTVLGQIDPGLAEERLLLGLACDRPGSPRQWAPAPEEYWKAWKEECSLADRILVNSEWSRKGLVQEGIPLEKIRVAPLAFEPPVSAKEFQRRMPGAFSKNRPLRVLFLGQVNRRKGMDAILEAMRLLADFPVEFHVVGPIQIGIPPELANSPRVRWLGAVPRSAVAKFYQGSDIFLFPTLSDGFGLTQLEAQSWKLPIIASTRCGQVVRDGWNGWLLEEVSGEAISGRLIQCLENPDLLAKAAECSKVSETFSLESLSCSLTGVFD